MPNEIRYFSMFSGVGGFEKGFENSQSLPKIEQDWEGWNRPINEYGIDDKGEKVKMSDTQRYKQMGNAVTTNVIKAVGERIGNQSQTQF